MSLIQQQHKPFIQDIQQILREGELSSITDGDDVFDSAARQPEVRWPLSLLPGSRCFAFYCGDGDSGGDNGAKALDNEEVKGLGTASSSIVKYEEGMQEAFSVTGTHGVESASSTQVHMASRKNSDDNRGIAADLLESGQASMSPDTSSGARSTSPLEFPFVTSERSFTESDKAGDGAKCVGALPSLEPEAEKKTVAGTRGDPGVHGVCGALWTHSGESPLANVDDMGARAEAPQKRLLELTPAPNDTDTSVTEPPCPYNKCSNACLDDTELVLGERASRTALAGCVEEFSDRKGSARAKETARGQALVRVSELSDVCAMCLGKYEIGEPVHVLPCLHIFHAQVCPTPRVTIRGVSPVWRNVDKRIHDETSFAYFAVLQKGCKRAAPTSTTYLTTLQIPYELSFRFQPALLPR